MKKLLLLLFFIPGFIHAQIVTIPNAPFKAALLQASPSNTIAKDLSGNYFKIDANNDNQIQVSEALQVSYLDITEKGVYGITGMEAFTNLITLLCSGNVINDLDLSENINLVTLDCSFSSVYNLDISQNVNLGNLNVERNGLSSLDVSMIVSLESLNCSRNFLTSLDVTNNANLESLIYSHNTLTSVDVTQNPNLQILECININQGSLTSLDVTQNSNLQILKCQVNSLNSLDVTQNPNLQVLECYQNPISNLDVSQNILLKELACNNSGISSLDVTNNLDLEILNCYNMVLSSIDVANNTDLEVLNCSDNYLTNLDISQNSSLTQLFCGANDLSSLDVTNNLGLQFLYFSYTNIDAIDISQNINLVNFGCSNNQISNLDLTQNINLVNFGCSNNQISNLDLTQNTNIDVLEFNNNQITTIDLSQNELLRILDANDNQLTTLDLSSNTKINIINCQNNQLETLFLKNGRDEYAQDISNNPDLVYICTEESQVEYMQNIAGSGVIVNSYCDFTPGGDFNTISGVISFDANNDGCDSGDMPAIFVRMDIDDGTNQSTSFVNSLGEYTFYTQSGDFVLTPTVENSEWFSFTPITSSISFLDNDNNTATQDFCITAVGGHNDVEVLINPIVPAQPGFDAIYQLVYRNKGNQTASGDIAFAFNDAVLDFISGSVNPDMQTSGNLTWNYTNLLPFETRSYTITLNVNAPTETPAVNIDDVLSFSADINTTIADENPDDNTFNLNEIVTGSYDPNDKTCLEGDSLLPEMIGEYIHYNINFENTGTAAATFVVVKDVIDETMFDIRTLQVMHVSHNMQTTISGQTVEFVFDNINLGPEEKGNVVFKIKTNNDLEVGDDITNMAEIYFDYNFPIVTNTTVSTFEILSVSEYELDNTISFFPNPTKDIINIKSKNAIDSIDLYDAQGRLVISNVVQETNVNINLLNFSKGIYFLKVKTNIGEKVEKVIKH